jgi:DNA polymerase-3 subunit gamma/tau
MYQALYRKWRPKTFDDVIAQPHIVTTLKNQLLNDKIAHAYLFTGSRGTGKTSCARILAKAINCKNPVGANPCLECENCIDADNSALMDIIEIDAASNNSVDDVRELRNSTAYTPERCKYKVFIIDEVHMLSISAFNALLKIMEEPPDYVKFILATTEVHKVPITILSRCQRYDFRRILPENIAERLDFVAEEENFKISANASLLIATLADGGMRDALSLLDRCSAITDDITEETVTAVAGIGSRRELFQLINAVISNDVSQAISVITDLYNNSKDMTRLCEELTLQLRNVMLLQVDNSHTNLLTNVMPDEVDELLKISKNITIHTTLRLLECLQKCSENLPRVPNKRVELEMCIVSMSEVGQGVQYGGGANQFSQLNVPQNLQVAPNSQPNVSQNLQVAPNLQLNVPQNLQVTPNSQLNVPQNLQVAPNLQPVPQVNNGEPVANWQEILGVYSGKDKGGYALLSTSQANFTYFNKELIITVTVERQIAKEYFNTEERKFKLKQSIAMVLGREYKLIIKVREVPVSVETLLNRAKIENINIEFEN